MHLRLQKKNDGRVYASIVRSYRDGKVTRSKVYKTIGYLDPRSPEYKEELLRCRRLADELEVAYQQENGSVVLEFSKKKKVDMRVTKRKNVGYVVLSEKYQSLEIDRFLYARAKKHSFGYDVNAIFRLLVWQRLLDPGSKSADFENRQWYFDKCDFSLKDLYRALDFFAFYKDAFLSRINSCIAKTRLRNTTEVYYDTTNYYFEIDKDDPDVVDEVSGKLTEGFRKRGASKEHRRSPIVSMGLLTDNDGLPIHYELFPGNKNDCETVVPVLKKVKKAYGLGRIIMVADKGINCSENIAACTLDKNGYVFSQSVRKSDKDLKAWVLSEEGYVCSEGFKCKSKQGMKTVYVTDGNGKQKEVELDVKYVAFWSADYDLRAKAQRECVIEKARKLASSKASYDHAKSYGAARYVKETVVDTATGEIKKTLLELDEEMVAKDVRYDGYYLIVTSETNKTNSEIIDIYKGLWRIEESFKVTKSELEDRPVRVWTPEHIEAHFLICYVALVIIRLIQLDLGYRYSAGKILAELASLQCSYLKDNIWHFDYRTPITDELCANAGITLNREIMTLKEIKAQLAKTRRP